MIRHIKSLGHYTASQTPTRPPKTQIQFLYFSTFEINKRKRNILKQINTERQIRKQAKYKKVDIPKPNSNVGLTTKQIPILSNLLLREGKSKLIRLLRNQLMLVLL